MQSQKKHYLRRCILLGMLVIVALAFYHGIVIRPYLFETSKLDAKARLRIVTLADLHSHIYGREQRDLIRQIKKADPDIIVMVGDMIDDEKPITGMTLLLKELQGVAPMYYVTGNHEYWSGHIKEIKQYMRHYHVTILENGYEVVTLKGQSLILAGLDDVAGFQDEAMWETAAKEAFKELAHELGYKVLLTHRPDLVDTYKQLPFDLVLSGHTHGGIVRIPYISNGFFAANQKLFPDYVGGLYQEEGLNLIVSRGLSSDTMPPRFFNPPEVTVIELVGK